MINSLPKVSKFIFRNGSLQHFSDGFRKHRNKIALKLAIIDINRVQLKRLRHFNGTNEYQKKKKIFYMLNSF